MTTLPDRNRKRAAVGRTVAILAALLGVLMIGGGVMKLAGQSVQVAAFTALELPAWFRALVGTFEVIGGTLLAIPASRPVGSLILSTIMVGALWAHAATAEWGPMVLVAILLALFLEIFRRDRARAVQLLEGA
jgi:putative oxidoreductase